MVRDRSQLSYEKEKKKKKLSIGYFIMFHKQLKLLKIIFRILYLTFKKNCPMRIINKYKIILIYSFILLTDILTIISGIRTCERNFYLLNKVTTVKIKFLQRVNLKEKPKIFN